MEAGGLSWNWMDEILAEDDAMTKSAKEEEKKAEVKEATRVKAATKRRASEGRRVNLWGPGSARPKPLRLHTASLELLRRAYATTDGTPTFQHKKALAAQLNCRLKDVVAWFDAVNACKHRGERPENAPEWYPTELAVTPPASRCAVAGGEPAPPLLQSLGTVYARDVDLNSSDAVPFLEETEMMTELFRLHSAQITIALQPGTADIAYILLPVTELPAPEVAVELDAEVDMELGGLMDDKVQVVPNAATVVNLDPAAFVELPHALKEEEKELASEYDFPPPLNSQPDQTHIHKPSPLSCDFGNCHHV